MNKKITDLEKQLLIKDHQLQLNNKELEIKDKDILYEKQKNEILELKLQVLQFQMSSPTQLSFESD